MLPSARAGPAQVAIEECEGPSAVDHVPIVEVSDLDAIGQVQEVIRPL